MSDWWNPLLESLPVLVEGSAGDSVRVMQHLLAAVDAGSVFTGEFDQDTRKVLNDWKRSVAGPADSKCDANTWKTLMHSIDGLPVKTKGDAGMDVKRIQHLLAAWNYLDSTVAGNFDAVWGDTTDAAKARFDADYGITNGTTCDQSSWTALLTGVVQV